MYSTVLYWDCPPSFSRTSQVGKEKQLQEFSSLLFPCSPSSFSGSAPLMVPSTESGIKVQCSLISVQWWGSYELTERGSRNLCRWWWSSHCQANCHFSLPSSPATCSPCPLLISTHKLPLRRKPRCFSHIPLGTSSLFTADGPSAPSASCHCIIPCGQVNFCKSFEFAHANSFQFFIQMKKTLHFCVPFNYCFL